MKAIVYETDKHGNQIQTCSMSTVGGVVRLSSMSNSGAMILSSRLAGANGFTVGPEDGDEFLKLLPSAYSGTRLRVGLEVDGVKEYPSETKQLFQPIIPRPSQPSIWEDRPPQQPNITINLVVPPEAIRVVIEQQAQPAPIVNVNVPDIVFPDIPAPVVNVIVPEQPAPIVNVEVPRQQRPVVNIEVPEQPAPVINIETQPVNVNVRVPKQPTPVVNVEAPNITVKPNIDVIVPPAQKPKKATITHSDGTTSEVEMS